MFNNVNRPEKYPDYDEKNNKSSVLRNTPYIELNIANFIKIFGFENEVKILELSWIKKERIDPCVLLEFKTEQAYLTSMYLMGRHRIPISNRYFGLQEKFENIGNSKFYYYNKLIDNSEWNKFKADYKKMDIEKMTSKDIYEYKRSVAPELNN